MVALTTFSVQALVVCVIVLHGSIVTGQLAAFQAGFCFERYRGVCRFSCWNNEVPNPSGRCLNRGTCCVQRQQPAPSNPIPAPRSSCSSFGGVCQSFCFYGEVRVNGQSSCGFNQRCCFQSGGPVIPIPNPVYASCSASGGECGSFCQFGVLPVSDRSSCARFGQRCCVRVPGVIPGPVTPRPPPIIPPPMIFDCAAFRGECQRSCLTAEINVGGSPTSTCSQRGLRCCQRPPVTVAPPQISFDCAAYRGECQSSCPNGEINVAGSGFSTCSQRGLRCCQRPPVNPPSVTVIPPRVIYDCSAQRGICGQFCPFGELSGNGISSCSQQGLRCCAQPGDPRASTPSPVTPTPQRKVCGKQVFNSRILNGFRPNSCSDWPWMTSIRLNSENRHICGGVLVSEDTVLTLRDCVIQFQSNDLSVVVGETDITQRNPDERVVPVSNVFFAPNVSNPATVGQLAMLKLSGPVVFTNCITPACLSSSVPATGSRCYIAGWGDNNAASSTLQVGQVTLMDRSQCQSRLVPQQILERDVLCSMPPSQAPDSQACYNDEGGMLVCAIDGVYSLVGLILSSTCPDPYHPSLYLDTTQYENWIRQRY